MQTSHTDPIRLDCRNTTCTLALRRVEGALRRLGRGARTLIVRTDVPEILDALMGWAARGESPHEVVRSELGIELRVYLLPRDFGGHPCSASVSAA